MRNIRPRCLPAVPGISNFLELNLRTYVYDRAGVPGVWFYSLDANQPLAVAIARRFFHLPYQRAKMKSTRTSAGAIRYESRRSRDPGRRCLFEYAPGDALPDGRPNHWNSFLSSATASIPERPTGSGAARFSIRRIRCAGPR